MPQPPDITIQLVHIHGPLKGEIQDFSRFPVLIGRHSSSQVRFDKDLTTISRMHARIEKEGNRFRLVDTSTNGTFVNGKRISDVYLREGDVIMFTENGPKASFLTQHETATPAPPSSVQAAPPHKAPPAQPQTPPSPPQPAAPPPSPSPPQPDQPDSGMTVGPDMDIPVVGTSAPLVIQFGATLRSFDLLPVTIGADPACEFVIASQTLAARHVQIFFSGNDYYVKDLTGRSMVTINDRPVGTRSVLAQGAEIALTPTGPRFRFLGGGRLAEIPDKDAVPAPAADIPPDQNQSDSRNETTDTKGKKKPIFKRFFK